MMNTLFSKKVLPAVTIEKTNDAVSTATAILNGGLSIMEIPFRTKVAAECIKVIRNEVPEMIVGAGTILTIEQLYESKKAGAAFALAPGFNPVIVKEAKRIGMPFIPGVMTPSEIELSLELGCTIQKIFPVSQIGGINMLKALLGPYGHTAVQFIPMGGVSLDNINEYLSLKNVIAVGGSWLATPVLVNENNWEQIEMNVKKVLSVQDNI